jgi:hypothetical protein
LATIHALAFDAAAPSGERRRTRRYIRAMEVQIEALVPPRHLR